MDTMVDVMRLEVPTSAHLAGLLDAMERGWSPSTIRDVRAETLAAIVADAEAYLVELNAPPGGRMVALSDGRAVPRLHQMVRWLWDGDFCGIITLRYQEGSDALPEHMLGHIGYHVVPWKQRRGYATQALRLMKQEARTLGMRRLIMSARPVNVATTKVIKANGGVEVERFVNPLYSLEERVRFHITL